MLASVRGIHSSLTARAKLLLCGVCSPAAVVSTFWLTVPPGLRAGTQRPAPTHCLGLLHEPLAGHGGGPPAAAEAIDRRRVRPRDVYVPVRRRCRRRPRTSTGF